MTAERDPACLLLLTNQAAPFPVTSVRRLLKHSAWAKTCLSKAHQRNRLASNSQACLAQEPGQTTRARCSAIHSRFRKRNPASNCAGIGFRALPLRLNGCWRLGPSLWHVLGANHESGWERRPSALAETGAICHTSPLGIWGQSVRLKGEVQPRIAFRMWRKWSREAGQQSSHVLVENSAPIATDTRMLNEASRLRLADNKKSRIGHWRVLQQL